MSGQRDLGGGKRNAGPIYVTSSSSNRQYPLDYTDWTKNGATPKTAFHSRSTYQIIEVEGRTMTYTAKDSTGLVVDRWVVQNSPGKGPKKVTNTESLGVMPMK